VCAHIVTEAGCFFSTRGAEYKPARARIPAGVHVKRCENGTQNSSHALNSRSSSLDCFPPAEHLCVYACVCVLYTVFSSARSPPRIISTPGGCCAAASWSARGQAGVIHNDLRTRRRVSVDIVLGGGVCDRRGPLRKAAASTFPYAR